MLVYDYNTIYKPPPSIALSNSFSVILIFQPKSSSMVVSLV